jgi:pimeloyl-ACP methyl ester carboxylesterase
LSGAFDARLAAIPGASHYVQEDEPKAFAAAIRRFLGETAYRN